MATKKKLLQVSGGLRDSYWIALQGKTSFNTTGFGMTIDSEDNIIMVGYTNGDGAGNNDGLITKYDIEGTVLWTRTLGGTSIDYFYNVAVDSSNNIYVCMREASQSAGSYDMGVVKYNSSGTLQWQRSLGSTSSENVYGIAIDSSGDIIIAGQTSSTTPATIAFSKYNSSGTLQWQRRLGWGSVATQGFSLFVDSSDLIYIQGYGSSSPTYAIYSRHNTDGTQSVSRLYYASSTDVILRGAALDSSGQVVVVGDSDESGGSGGDDMYISKVFATGNIIWNTLLGGSGTENGWGIAIDSQDNIIVVGNTTSEGAGNYDGLIAKYNSSGTLQWQRTLGGTGIDFLRDVVVDSNDNIIVTGYVDITDGSGARDWAVVARLPPDGSGTGTYGDLTYATSTLTSSSSVVAATSTSFSNAATSLTDAATTLTDAVAVLTETSYSVP